MGEVTQVPESHQLVVSGAGEEAADWAERHRIDRFRVGQGRSELFGAGRFGQVPQPHCLVDACAGEGAPARAERHRIDRVGVPGQG